MAFDLASANLSQSQRRYLKESNLRGIHKRSHNSHFANLETGFQPLNQA